MGAGVPVEFLLEPPPIAEEHVHTWSIGAEVAEKNRVIDAVVEFLGPRVTLTPELIFRYRLCLDEAITNSITHGCEGVESPLVTIDLYWSPGSWAVRIVDPGQGFSGEQIVAADTLGTELRETGRGILILQQYADRLVYSRGGCEQTLWIKTGDLRR